MTTPLDILKTYFAASNARDFAAIALLLDDDIVYESDNAGSHQGKTAVLDMMQGFFAQFTELAWTIDTVIADEPDAADVAFTCRAVRTDGSPLHREGLERIEVKEGLIQRVWVRGKNGEL